MRLQFLGAAGCVTGSSYLLEVNGARILVDCGMFQERNFSDRNWGAFTVPPQSVDVLLLTHAHIDHSGLIPKLCRDGFGGAIYTTPATVDLSQVMLLDSAHIQEEDARFKRARHRVEGRDKRAYLPLYTQKDARDCFPQFRGVPYDQEREVADGVSATWRDAGHMLGSAHIELRVRERGVTTVILFSGDIGNLENPILRNPTTFDYADIILCESTYGAKLHEPRSDANRRLADAVNAVVAVGGSLVIPAFAVGRAQELLYEMKGIRATGHIPELPTFMDSPMAISATEVFQRHPECWNQDMRERVHTGDDPFYFPKLTCTRDAEESRAIAFHPGSKVIISASGMCEAGRIKHHLVNNISEPRNRILFIAYQAEGTLGRHILDGENPVRILGAMRDVRAAIESISGFSAHADQQGLVNWLAPLKASAKQVFLTHGETGARRIFRDYLQERWHCPIHAPAWKETVHLT